MPANPPMAVKIIEDIERRLDPHSSGTKLPIVDPMIVVVITTPFVPMG